MSQSALIEKDLHGPYLLFEEIAKDLHALTISIDNQSLVDTVSDLRNRIRDPFMFVIVGEVKVGKSSFINALLQTTTEICKVAPSPMTDTIQQIVYGPEYMEISISPVLKRITYPEEILKEIAIVDTPGTNTIVQHHQEITEKFIPVSDLVMFVFEAKNPYRQSAWDLFTYIKEDWRKKIIFVLQQKDLMSNEDLQVNINGLRQFAVQKGIDEPMIFPVSAKMELEGHSESSGFIDLRHFIKENITGGKAAFLKLLNNIDNCTNISQKLQAGIQLRKDQYDYDIEFRNDISKTLKEHERISFNNVNLLIENLVAAYQNSSASYKKELENGLGFINVIKKGITGIFNKDNNLHAWLEDFKSRFESTLKQNLREKLELNVQDISDSIMQMAQIVSLKIKGSRTVLKNDHEIFSEIADKRAGVMSDLQQTFNDFIRNSENYYSSELLKSESKLAPNVATGTGIAIIGTIITALTHGAVFDITGGVLTSLGLLFAGITLGFNRRRILQKFDHELVQGKNGLEEELRHKLGFYITEIKTKIDHNFSKFDEHLVNEKKAIVELNQKHTSILERLGEVKSIVERMFSRIVKKG